MARRASAFAALFILAAGLSGCNKLKARDLLNKGVAEFKAGSTTRPLSTSNSPKILIPAWMNARLYLATLTPASTFRRALRAEHRLGTQAVNGSRNPGARS